MRFSAEITLAIILALMVAVAVGAQTNQQYTVKWTPSPSVFTGSTNITVSPDAYNLFVTTNVALPVAQWTLAAVFQAESINPSSSNYVATTAGVFTVALQPPIFVSMTYSNGNGTSPFSNQAGLQAFPVAPAVKSISSP